VTGEWLEHRLESDGLASLKERIGKKLELEQDQLAQTTVKYEWIGVRFEAEIVSSTEFILSGLLRPRRW
jgi:hypothetical protein